MPEPTSTEAAAAAAGLTLPQPTDLQSLGDDAIRRNARFTADALARAAAAEGVAADAVGIAADKADPEDGLLPTYDPLAVFAVTDEDGRRTWLEVAPNGGPTDHAADKIAAEVGPAVAAEVGVQEQSTAVSGLSFAVTDEDGRRTWLEADEAGHPTDHALELIGDGLQIGEVGTATALRATYSPAEFPAASGPDIVCWGDSMTAGAGGNGRGYPVVLAELTGRTIHNRGVGGESSVTITMRSGATPMLVTPAGGSIPASGAVDLVQYPIPGTDGRITAPLLQGSAGWPSGTLAGIPGTITRVTAADGVSNLYRFTRTTAGTAVTVDRPTPFLSADAEARRGDIAIIWIGQNGPSHTRAKADVRAIVQHLRAADTRFLVISRPTSSDAEDTEWHDLYGRRFLSIRQYLVQYGLADAGLTATDTDTADMAAGRVPTSLRVDAVHFNAAGYDVLARQLNNRLREMGWI